MKTRENRPKAMLFRWVIMFLLAGTSVVFFSCSLVNAFLPRSLYITIPALPSSIPLEVQRRVYWSIDGPFVGKSVLKVMATDQSNELKLTDWEGSPSGWVRCRLLLGETCLATLGVVLGYEELDFLPVGKTVIAINTSGGAASDFLTEYAARNPEAWKYFNIRRLADAFSNRLGNLAWAWRKNTALEALSACGFRSDSLRLPPWPDEDPWTDPADNGGLATKIPWEALRNSNVIGAWFGWAPIDPNRDRIRVGNWMFWLPDNQGYCQLDVWQDGRSRLLRLQGFPGYTPLNGR